MTVSPVRKEELTLKWRLFGAAACVLLFCSLPRSAFATALTSYTDIAGNFAQTDIVNLSNMGYIHGFGDGAFRPADAVTRGQFLAYFMNVVEPTTNVQPTPNQRQYYRDILPGNWAYAYIGAAQQAGWIVPYWIGVAQGQNFNENYQASRGDAASFYVAALEHSPRKFTLPAGVSPLAYANSIGLFAGLPATENPVYLNRADAAVVLTNVQTLLSGSSGAAAGPTEPIILGWNYGSAIPNYLAEDTQAPPLNTFVYDGMHLSAAGSFTNTLGSSYADTLHAQGKIVWALFGNANNQTVTDAVLATPAARLALSQQIAQICLNDHVDGANIDFENMPSQDRQPFSLFIETLASVLHQVHLSVSVDVAPPSAGSWSAAYDYSQLASFANDIVVMTYDQHWGGDPTPGPVTSLPWVQQNVTQLLASIPKSQFVLGIPLYTRSWNVAAPTTGAYDIPLQDMTGIIAKGLLSTQTDSAANQVIDTYKGNGGTTYEFWQDGPSSLQAIGNIAVTDGLAGVAYWRLGFENPAAWSAIIPYPSPTPSK